MGRGFDPNAIRDDEQRGKFLHFVAHGVVISMAGPIAESRYVGFDCRGEVSVDHQNVERQIASAFERGDMADRFRAAKISNFNLVLCPCL
jgi:hypothetical protein